MTTAEWTAHLHQALRDLAFLEAVLLAMQERDGAAGDGLAALRLVRAELQAALEEAP